MTADDLISQFNFNQHTLLKSLGDVTHEESLQSPQPAGNCLNWVLGHLIATRAYLIATHGGEPLLSEEECKPYLQEPGSYSKASAKSLDELERLLSESFERVNETLKQTEPTMNNPAEGKSFIRDGETVGDRIGYYVCHEAYHCGQIGLLRRLLGKPGVF
jgi:uncharacterized damage-inducible protein DinB